MTTTPCKSTCELDQQDKYCIKCGRDTVDIQNWINYSEEKRKQIVKEIKQRRKKDELGISN
jgi:predicted Fe-S protein YdhL (DUF1289 family)